MTQLSWLGKTGSGVTGLAELATHQGQQTVQRSKLFYTVHLRDTAAYELASLANSRNFVSCTRQVERIRSNSTERVRLARYCSEARGLAAWQACKAWRPFTVGSLASGRSSSKGDQNDSSCSQLPRTMVGLILNVDWLYRARNAAASSLMLPQLLLKAASRSAAASRGEQLTRGRLQADCSSAMCPVFANTKR